MRRALRILKNRRLLVYFVAPNAVFWAVAGLTTAVQLLPLLSLVTSALALGICVAFFPAVLAFFEREGALSTGEALTLGIWCSWFATALLGVFTFVWRAVGQPLWLINNDAVGYLRFLTICGACLHLASPDAITDRIPSTRWIKIGGAVAALVLVILIISYVASMVAEMPRGPQE